MEELMQLKKLQKNFPFFHLPHALMALHEKKNKEENSASLSMAALTSTNRPKLKKWIDDSTQSSFIKNGFQEPPSNNSTESTSSLSPNLGQKDPIQSQEKPKKRKLPQDDLIESIKRKEKKEILDSKKQEQIDLIKAFSKKEIKVATLKEIEAIQQTENLAASSTRLNDQTISETFAKLLLKQGKKDMAIEIYTKLALKFPQKRAYFADLIQKIKA
ncbi:MAG: hypothetical protein ACK5BR_01900 [Bacteroidota bacterium]|jgi:hypothetical protein|nr:hypothetical protein [Algoriphagus sp.]